MAVISASPSCARRCLLVDRGSRSAGKPRGRAAGETGSVPDRVYSSTNTRHHKGRTVHRARATTTHTSWRVGALRAARPKQIRGAHSFVTAPACLVSLMGSVVKFVPARSLPERRAAAQSGCTMNGEVVGHNVCVRSETVLNILAGVVGIGLGSGPSSDIVGAQEAGARWASLEERARGLTLFPRIERAGFCVDDDHLLRPGRGCTRRSTRQAHRSVDVSLQHQHQHQQRRGRSHGDRFPRLWVGREFVRGPVRVKGLSCARRWCGQ